MTKTTSKQRRDIYAEVTDQIKTALENGTVPWHRPWVATAGERHTNLVSHKPYRGINPFLLDLAAQTNAWSSPYWVTFKQADALATKVWERDGKPMKVITPEKGEPYQVPDKGGVRKGERGTLVVFWKQITIEEEKNGEKIKKRIPLLRHYIVFNVEQCDDIDAPVIERPHFDGIEAAQKVIDNLKKLPKPRHGGNSAYYAPGLDLVAIPEPTAFETPEAYYSTVFHEETHATGADTRLKRFKDDVDQFTFASESYSKEELVAEMGASMVCAFTGIFDSTRNNSASYIANWLEKLGNDNKLVVSAAAQAQHAADMILGTEPQENGEVA